MIKYWININKLVGVITDQSHYDSNIKLTHHYMVYAQNNGQVVKQFLHRGVHMKRNKDKILIMNEFVVRKIEKVFGYVKRCIKDLNMIYCTQITME